MKKIFLILFSVVLLISGILSSISCSCDKNTLEYDGNPISITGRIYVTIEDRKLR